MSDWIEADEIVQWQKLLLLCAAAAGAVWIFFQPVVWKTDAHWLGCCLFVPLAAYCVRLLLRLKSDNGRYDVFGGKTTRVLYGLLLACAGTLLAVNLVLLFTLLPLTPAVEQARVVAVWRSTRACNTWTLELEDGTQAEICYGMRWQMLERQMGRMVRVRLRENRLGYYVRAE